MIYVQGWDSVDASVGLQAFGNLVPNQVDFFFTKTTSNYASGRKLNYFFDTGWVTKRPIIIRCILMIITAKKYADIKDRIINLIRK